jgi:hypothetical protein
MVQVQLNDKGCALLASRLIMLPKATHICDLLASRLIIMPKATHIEQNFK